MSKSKSDLCNSIDALNAYCEKLNRFFYGNFHFVELPSLSKLSSANTYIKASKGAIEAFQSMLYEMRRVLAYSLECYMGYRNSWFSDMEFAKSAKMLIDKASAELEKMNHFFSNYKIIEE